MTVRKRTGYHGPLSSALFSFVNTVYARPRTRLLGIAAIAQVSPSMIAIFFPFLFFFLVLSDSSFSFPRSGTIIFTRCILEDFSNVRYLNVITCYDVRQDIE